MTDADLTALWSRYAATWSRPDAERESELRHCVTADVNYRDPHSDLHGEGALSDYMAGFRASVPGGRFTIREVFGHHGYTLAHWTMLGPDGTALQQGSSVAELDDDDRFRRITGFFPPA